MLRIPLIRVGFSTLFMSARAWKLIFALFLFSGAVCTEDKYLEEYEGEYNRSPENEVYVEVVTDENGIPAGKIEFDQGYSQAESSKWSPANSFYLDKYEYPNRKGALPLVNVDWYEAKELCERQFVDLNGNGVQDFLDVNDNGVQDEGDIAEKNKRLCASAEWKETCRGRGVNGPAEKDGMWGYGTPEAPAGTKDFHFPYGGNGQSDFYKPGYCNDDSSGAAPSGDFKNCINNNTGSAHPITQEVNGANDLTGNVWEWVDFDFYGALPSEPGAEDCAANEGDPSVCVDEYVGQKQILGGYYLSYKFANCNRSFIIPADSSDIKIGFRCCRD